MYYALYEETIDSIRINTQNSKEKHQHIQLCSNFLNNIKITKEDLSLD